MMIWSDYSCVMFKIRVGVPKSFHSYPADMISYLQAGRGFQHWSLDTEQKTDTHPGFLSWEVCLQCVHSAGVYVWVWVSAWLPFKTRVSGGLARPHWPTWQLASGYLVCGGCCPHDSRERQAVQAEDIPAFAVSPRWKIQAPPRLISSSSANRPLCSAGLVETLTPAATAPPVSLMKL